MNEFYREIDKYRGMDGKGRSESNRQFAQRIGTDGNTIRYWRMGGKPHTQTIAKICENLGLPNTEFDRLCRIVAGLDTTGIRGDR